MKERLLKAAAQLFCQKGYHATSLSDIAELCGLQKASIFHHFPSKQAIAIGAIAELQLYCNQQIFNLSAEVNQSPEQRMINFVKATHDFMLERFDAGMISFLAMELIDVLPIFNQPIKDYFDSWLQAMYTVLIPLHGKEKAIALSNNAMIFLQGLLVMTRVTGDQAYVRQCAHHLITAWRAE
jgi:TetR/AcrR family transcriptional repressor of nem operon